ncbi:SDR family oxidoreductase [Gaiella sp.]|uniref:SDR family oxidoreductase n=1 Tax=Gaiella sp. TaxID=2663207 RepID=UPI0039831F49
MPSALITGGSSGIGLAIARMLGAEGYSLTLAGRQLDRLETARDGLDAAIVVANVSSEDDCARVVDEHVATHGGLDVLVNSAGVGIAGTLADTSVKAWDLQLAVNLRGAFLVTQAALPHLRSTKGYVINLASIAGTLPTPGLGAYGASKAALIALTRTLDREEADAGVRATAICPAFVDTQMAAWTGIPGEEMIAPEDCAEVVRALLRLSPYARIPVVVIERAGESV